MILNCFTKHVNHFENPNEIIHSFQVDSDMEEVFKEKEAYELQNKFLEELSLKNDMIKILNVKKCRSNQLNKLFKWSKE